MIFTSFHLVLSIIVKYLICCQAAQALEPAALVPLQLLAPGGQVVLVGDPKQLPPTVLSRAAEASNLAQSLFERLQQVCLPDLAFPNRPS